MIGIISHCLLYSQKYKILPNIYCKFKNKFTNVLYIFLRLFFILEITIIIFEKVYPKYNILFADMV